MSAFQEFHIIMSLKELNQMFDVTINFILSMESIVTLHCFKHSSRHMQH